VDATEKAHGFCLSKRSDIPLKSKWKQRQAGGCRQEPTANPHTVESGKGSITIVGHRVYTLIEALIAF
jgi:hypothetical protein